MSNENQGGFWIGIANLILLSIIICEVMFILNTQPKLKRMIVDGFFDIAMYILRGIDNFAVEYLVMRGISDQEVGDSARYPKPSSDSSD